jgi:hypothetical protein
MSDKNRKTWYIGERGELLAQIFLTDLNPINVNRSGENDLFDYMATFAAPNGMLRLIAVEVKATERPIKDKYAFKADLIRKLSSINIPVLILVVNVKSKAIYYTWAQTAAKLLPRDADAATLQFPVKRADENKAELLQEIVAA